MTQAQEDHRHKMLELARQWRDSGTKARTFAQEHGVTAWTLYYWRKRIVEQERSARRLRRPRRRVRLAPVHVIPVAQEGAGDLEIILTNGNRLRVPTQVSVEALRRVVDVLRTAC